MAKSQLNLVNLFLDIAQTRELASLKEGLSDLLPHEEEVSEPPAELSAEEQQHEDADLRSAVEAMGAEAVPFRSFFQLMDAKERLASREKRGFSGEEDEERHKETLALWERKYDRVVAQWNHKARGSAVRLFQLIRDARDCLAIIIAWLDMSSGAELTGQSLSELVDRLDGLIDEIDSLSHLVPVTVPESIPGWDAFQNAKAGLIKTHHKNLLLYKCAIMMTRADGEMSPVERDFLFAVARRIRLSRPEAALLLGQPTAIRLAEFGGTPVEARDLIHNLALCAFADGVVAESEKRMLVRIGHSLGLDQEQVYSILEGEQTSLGTVVLDTQAVRDFLLSQPKMPQHTSADRNIPPEVAARIRKQLGIPPDEDLFLVYENRFLDKTVECGALTGNRLYLRTPRGAQHNVMLKLIEGAKSGSMWVDLLLTDRRSIRMSRTAEAFLKIVVSCVTENLKLL